MDVGERWAGVISSSVGFAGKDEDELENPCELTMDEVIFNDCFDKTSKLWIHVGVGVVGCPVPLLDNAPYGL